MIREYEQGVHETLDVTLTNVGSAKNALRADGIFKNAFYDFALYTDSGYTTPISASSYESSTIDAYYTSQEIGFTDETVYNEYRVLDPTYQTGTIYARFESFGVYTSGEAVGQNLTVVSASDTYTTNPYALMERFEASGLSADITITVTDGGGDQRNQFEYTNLDSTYKVIVTDGVTACWVEPGQTIQFFYKNGVLSRSPGRGLIYDVPGNTTNVSESALLQGVADNTFYFHELVDGSSNTLTCEIRIKLRSNDAIGEVIGTNLLTWDSSATTFTPSNATHDIKKIWRLYV